MTDESTALPKPRRHWRVTKAQLLGRIAELEAFGESRSKRLDDAVNSVAYWHGKAQQALSRAYRAEAWAIAGGFGWLAFAVAVVWL